MVAEYAPAPVLGPIASVTLFLSVNNFDDGGEFGILDYFNYSGNGVPDNEDQAAGDAPYANTFHDEQPNPWGLHYVDTTDVYFAAMAAGWSHLGIRISTLTSDRFHFNWAIEVPDPVLVFDFRTFDLIDHAAFLECVAGPETEVSEECATYDFDRDLDVDMADFSLFQIGFDAGIIPPFTTDCCDTNHGPGCTNPDDENWDENLEWFCSNFAECCEVDWDELCILFAEALDFMDCGE